MKYEGRAEKGVDGAEGEGGARGNGRAQKPLGIQELFSRATPEALRELFQFWGGQSIQAPPEDVDELKARVTGWMRDPVLVEERIGGLGRRLGTVVEELIAAPRHQRTAEELARARALSYLTSYDLEACLLALQRRGLVVQAPGPQLNGERVVGVPAELAEGVQRRRREKLRGIFGVLTLRGHLDQVYSDPAQARRMTPQRLRELYKLYSQETASTSRIERLPEGVRGLVERAILEFGGFLPRQLFERMESELPHWNGRRWRMILEQSLIGTVQDLDLLRYGINHQDETLLVFNEVALAWLRRVAVPGDPDRPHEELSLGIDLASNISRFLAYIDENDVRFTVQGEIFKTTEKKILQHLIPNPGRELSREAALSFIFRFAKHAALIDRTGKRTFSLTTEGRRWGARELYDKQKALLEFALADRRLTGEQFHQVRMRQIFMRLLKRVEPGVWYDLMYLPFLARNAYLSSLDDLHVEEHFSQRSQSGRVPVMEDPQRLAWNLVKWVRQRLYLLGLIDLGYDRARRPVAMRLTHGGARLLGLDRIGPMIPSRVGSLVVTPDFEVVLFPTGDDVELIHDLDRFCVREKLGSVMHFRITQEAVRRGLKGGMVLRDVLRTLEAHSRTPIPQNVRFSIRDWAVRAGLMTLSDDLVLRCEDPETLRRFQQDPGTRKYVSAVLEGPALQLVGRVTPRRLQALLRDLGYLVELEESE